MQMEVLEGFFLRWESSVFSQSVGMSLWVGGVPACRPVGSSLSMCKSMSGYSCE